MKKIYRILKLGEKLQSGDFWKIQGINKLFLVNVGLETNLLVDNTYEYYRTI